MSGSTRRDFLKTSALIGGGLMTADFAALTRAAFAADTLPTMAIARWDEALLASADLALAAVGLTEAAVASLGGMERFVNKGDTVWVKPNIGWNRRPELAANTNPEVVGTIVRLCLAAGAKTVKVGDHPCHPARQAYRNSGIAEAAEAAGGKMVYLDEKRFQDMTLGGQYLDKWPIYLEVAEADLVINIPILKHHGLTKCSLAMKNYMGVIGGNRSAWHQNMDDCVADITQLHEAEADDPGRGTRADRPRAAGGQSRRRGGAGTRCREHGHRGPRRFRSHSAGAQARGHRLRGRRRRARTGHP